MHSEIKAEKEALKHQKIQIEDDIDDGVPSSSVGEHDVDDKSGGKEINEENSIPEGHSEKGENEGAKEGKENEADPPSESSEEESETLENQSSESVSTVLLSEGIEKEVEDPLSNDHDSEEIDQEELQGEIEKELEEGVEAINKYLEEEAEFINAYQEMIEKEWALDQEREKGGEESILTEEEWEEKVETASYTAEQLYESRNEQEIESENEAEQIKENLGQNEKEFETEEELDQNLVEQHQVEPLIEEALATEPESIVNENELDKLQEMELEKQFQTIQLKEYIEELVEKQEEDHKEFEKELEEKEKTETRESDLKEAELERELLEEVNEVEQHQVETLIEEALETETETIVNEEEIEKLQEMELEEQFQTIHLKEQINDILEGQDEEIEQRQKEEVDVQKDTSKEINADLEEELELNLVEQHQVEPFIEEALESEVNYEQKEEEEIEQIQELELDEQFETVRNNEYIEELVEREEELNELTEHTEHENEKADQAQEETQNWNYLNGQLEEQERKLELDYEVKEEIEQHQVEEAIEQELETEPEPIIEEDKLEHIKNLEPERQIGAELLYELVKELKEKQNDEPEELKEKEEHEELTKEEKIAQITQELEISLENESRGNEVEFNSKKNELDQEDQAIDNDKGLKSELEESYYSQQELEEISDEIDKEYERMKELYREQTGKRPIYANKETKGFEQWLELRERSNIKHKEVEKKKEKQKEQKKEEVWKWSIKNWIVRTYGIDPELKSELLKLVKKYDELEKLIKKCTQLYNKAQRENLSQTENSELKSLIKSIQKLNPIKIELFLGMREMKYYLEGQYYQHFWDKPYVNRIRRHFFTILSQRYTNLREAQNREKIEELINKWIENASEEEINPKMKALLNKIVEDYNEMDAMSIRFMELYKKSQNKQISKNEKEELKLINITLKKIDPVIVEIFTRIRAFKRFLNDQNIYKEKSQNSRNFYRFFASIKRTSEKSLSSMQIKNFLDENKQIQPVTGSQKSISSKAWGALRKLLWSETDKLIKNNFQKFEDLSSDNGYKILNSILITYLNKKFNLSKQRLSQEQIDLLKKAVITIYLLNQKEPPSQAEIRRIARFTGNRQVKEIKDHLKMNLKSSDLKQTYIEIAKSVELNRDQISRSILQFTNINLKKFQEIEVHQNTNREYFITLIREIFIYLKNNTDSLKYLTITQLQKIPVIIYDIIKEIFKNRKVYREEQFIDHIRKLYGFIYLGTNLKIKKKKVYVGQTINTIEEEWGDILKRGKGLKKKRQENPDVKISSRYILNAIAKYGPDVWELRLIDIAFNKSELDAKERYYIKIYDSMNPEKGYNLTTGGRTGGRLSPATKKKVSKSVQNVWNSPGYRERLGKVQSKSWESEERREINIKGLIKSWKNEKRRQLASEQAYMRWEDEKISEKMKLGLSRSAKNIWRNPTKAMLKNLEKLHQKTRKEISNVKEFLTDIKNTKNQSEFWQGDLFKKYGIKTHMTLNRRIKEILGGFGVANHGEAHRFFYDRSVNEVMKYLENPKGYNLFNDPFTKQFFIDVKNSNKGIELHKKYRVWHKQGLIAKIKRIVGKFGINNYTSLKIFLQDKGINQSLKHFANLEKNSI